MPQRAAACPFLLWLPVVGWLAAVQPAAVWQRAVYVGWASFSLNHMQTGLLTNLSTELALGSPLRAHH